MNKQKGTDLVRGKVLPPAPRELRMPQGTPLGLGFLGAARFAAIKRVIEAYERARRAEATAIDAEAAVAEAHVRRGVALTHLHSLPVICASEEDRIAEGAELERLRRELERLELEDQIADRKARRAKIAGEGSQRSAISPDGGVAQDDFAAFMSDLRRMPEVVQAVQQAKAQVVRDAGDEAHLSEPQRQICDTLDAMLQSFMSKKAEETAV
jgi:hypothetical protein